MSKTSLFIYGERILSLSVLKKIHKNYFNSSLSEEQQDKLVIEILNIILKNTGWRVDNNNNKHELQILPVKLHGFFRAYTSEKENGTHLQLYKTDDTTKFTNGLLLNGVTTVSNNKKSEGRESFEINSSDIELYNNIDENLQLTDDICKIQVQKQDNINWTTMDSKDILYTSRIFEGIEKLGDIYGEKFSDQFYEDFQTYTYENPDVNPFVEKPNYVDI